MSHAKPEQGSDRSEATARSFDPSNLYRGFTGRLGFSFSVTYLNRPRVPPAKMARLRRKVRQNPRNARARWELGKKLDVAGKEKEAIRQLRFACRLDSGNPEFQLSLGEALPFGASATSHFRTALQLCRRALRKRPNDADLYFTMGRTLNHLDDDAGALAAFRKAIALRPEFAEAYWELSSKWTRWPILGESLISEEESLAAMREAVRLKREHAEYREVLAMRLSSRDDHPGAIAEYREAIRLQPDDPETHWDLGLELEAVGDRDGAEAEFREAVRLDPRTGANGYFNRADDFIQKGDASTAISFLRKSVEVYPLTHAWNTLGVVYHLSGNLDKAVESYREAIRMKRSRDYFPTDHIYAHNNLAIAFEEKGDLESALRELRAALRLDRNNHGTRENLGVVFEKMGDLRRAVEQYEKVLKSKHIQECEECRSNYARLSAELKSRSARRPRRRRSQRRSQSA